MSKVGIITDTGACIPQELVQMYGIGLVPFIMSINGKSYLDEVEITPEKFWQMFPDMREFSSGAPSQAIFMERFREMARRSDKIACIFMSRLLSGMYQSAVQARDMFLKENPGVRIDIIDSQTTIGAQAFVVIESARAAEEGKSLEEVVETAKDMRSRVKFFAAMDSLKYVIRSGRAPKTAYVGELFQIKPIIGMTNNSGVVENLGRARGKSAASQKLVEMIGQVVDTTKPLHAIVQYTNNISDAERLKELVQSKYRVAELYMTPYSPVVSGHSGPALAVACYSK